MMMVVCLDHGERHVVDGWLCAGILLRIGIPVEGKHGVEKNFAQAAKIS